MEYGVPMCHFSLKLVMSDLSSTFDLVEWDQLLNVLQNEFGVTGTALKWYENYLMPEVMLIGKRLCHEGK